MFEWYIESGLNNIGYESEDVYDENFNYVGKGPEGHYELLSVVSEIASELQNEGFISKKFGKTLPIIIHGLEYAWFDIEATKHGNPNGEADIYLRACKELGFTE